MPKWPPEISPLSTHIPGGTIGTPAADHRSSVQRQQRPQWFKMVPTGCGRRAGGVVPGKGWARRAERTVEDLGAQEKEDRHIGLRESESHWHEYLNSWAERMRWGPWHVWGFVVWPTLCKKWAAFVSSYCSTYLAVCSRTSCLTSLCLKFTHL